MKFTFKPAEAVVVGDSLVTPDGVFPVTQIDTYDLGNDHRRAAPGAPMRPSWPVLRLLTTYKGYARFGHENVQVIDAATAGDERD